MTTTSDETPTFGDLTLSDDERDKASKTDADLAGAASGFSFKPGFDANSADITMSSGAGIFDTIVSLNHGVEHDNEAFMAASGVALAFDAVGLVLNPFGSLFAAGVGWLIDHLFFLREPLDMLMGDPNAIRAQQARITNEAEEYATRIAPGQIAAVKKVEGWTGEAHDRFLSEMKKVNDELAAVGEALKGLADIMGWMSACVAAFRNVVRDIIAMTVGDLIAGALTAVAMAPFTFGASIAAFVAVAVGTALTALGKITKLLTTLTKAMSKNAANMAKINRALANIGKGGKRGKGTGPKPGSSPKPKSNPTKPANSGKSGKNKPVNPSKNDMKNVPLKQRMDMLDGVTDQAMVKALTSKLGKSHAEAFQIVRWIRNFENVADAGGSVRGWGRSCPTGNSAHLLHELWKEFGCYGDGG